MTHHPVAGEGARPAPGGELALLVETEQRLAERLARAREEATALLDAARAEASAREVELEQELARVNETAGAELASDRDRRVAEVLAAGREKARALEALGGQRVDELAKLAVERVVRGMRP